MLSVQHPPYSPVSASSIPSGGLYQPSPDYDKAAAAAMMHQSPTASQGRPSTSRFDSHDDFYDFLDSNRMGDGRPLPMPSAPGSASGNMGGRPPSSSSSHHQQQQQREGPPAQRLVDQPRPPVTRGGGGPGGPGGGQPQARSRAPSYGSGSRSEEMLVDKHRRQNSGRPGTASKGAQTQGGGGGGGPMGPRSPSMSGDRTSSYQNMNGRAPSPGSDHSPAAAGNAIQRLKSPTVVDHVLQPLEKKVNEYAALMDSEEDSVSQLDVEIAMLQERRAQAEARFMDAKSKHDEYRRQYADVERALRGEAPPMPTQSTREMAMRQASAQPPQHQMPGQPPHQQMQQPPPQSMNGPPMGRPSMHHDDDLDDLDDDEEFLDDQRRPVSRRITSQQSFGRSSQGGKKGRFRFSLFGGEK